MTGTCASFRSTDSNGRKLRHGEGRIRYREREREKGGEKESVCERKKDVPRAEVEGRGRGERGAEGTQKREEKVQKYSTSVAEFA